jgi:hypothetical protein
MELQLYYRSGGTLSGSPVFYRGASRIQKKASNCKELLA